MKYKMDKEDTLTVRLEEYSGHVFEGFWYLMEGQIEGKMEGEFKNVLKRITRYHLFLQSCRQVRDFLKGYLDGI